MSYSSETGTILQKSEASLMKLVMLLLLGLSFSAWAEPAPQLPHPPREEPYLRVSHDGSRVMLVAQEEVWVWDADQSLLLRQMEGFERVTDARFSPDGASLVVSDYPRWFGFFDSDGSVEKRWEFRDPVPDESTPQSWGAYRVQFSPDGKYLMALGASPSGREKEDETFRIFDTSSGKVVKEYPQWLRPRFGHSQAFAFTPDSRGFVRGQDDTLSLYSLPEGELFKKIDLGQKMAYLLPHRQGVLCVMGSDRREADNRLYSTPGLEIIETRLSQDEAAPVSRDSSLSWSRQNGKLTVINDGKVVYEGKDWEYVRSWVAGGGFLLFSEGEGDNASFPQLRDATGQQIGAFWVNHINPQGTLACKVPGYGGETPLYNLKTGALLDTISYAHDAEFSGDGKRLAISLKTGVLLIDVEATLAQGTLVPL